MNCTWTLPAALRLPVAFFALALASGVPADDPDGRPSRTDIPAFVTQRVDLLIHEPVSATPDPVHAPEGRHGTAPARPGG